MKFDGVLKGTGAAAIMAFAHIAPVAIAAEPGQAGEVSWTQYSYDPYPFAYYVDDVDRYPAATPPENTVNRHGEIEYIGNGVFGAHWFVDVDDTVWHFVTAGDPSKDVIVFLHGWPDTWYSYHKVMAELADDYYIIALDTLGYGQSDKRAEVDVSYAGATRSLIGLLDKIGVDEFNLVAHDRGSILSDHLIATDGMSDRIATLLRMQQSFDQPHGLPRPPHAMMATPGFQGREGLIRNLYNGPYVSVQMPESEVARLAWEFEFPGTPEAAARTFVGTNFQVELDFRMENTIPKMTMPVVFLQGLRDRGQWPEEYYRSPDIIPNGRVVFVDTNHFIHAEDPMVVARVARNLIEKKNRNRPNKISFEPVSFLYPEKE
ncbi:MAG: alpha/beta hydrolase [Pseudomonadota bacterium]